MTCTEANSICCGYLWLLFAYLSNSQSTNTLFTRTGCVWTSVSVNTPPLEASKQKTQKHFFFSLSSCYLLSKYCLPGHLHKLFSILIYPLCEVLIHPLYISQLRRLRFMGFSFLPYQGAGPGFKSWSV